MIEIYLLPLRTLSESTEELTELAHGLPFGKSEKERLVSLISKGTRSAAESLGGLIALSRLTERASVSSFDIVRDGNGRPRFYPQNGFDFNISHSSGLAVAALSDEGGIGIDVEFADCRKHYSGIADRFFADEEKKHYYENEASPDTFLRIWTAKEARAKLTGVGLAAELSERNDERSHKRSSQKLYSVELDGHRGVLCICAEHIGNVKFHQPTNITKKELSFDELYEL